MSIILEWYSAVHIQTCKKFLKHKYGAFHDEGMGTWGEEYHLLSKCGAWGVTSTNI